MIRKKYLEDIVRINGGRITWYRPIKGDILKDYHEKDILS